MGLRLHGSQSGWSYRGEVATQIGTRGDKDVSAYMLGARVGRSLREGRSSLVLWWDYLSGDADAGDGEVKVFDTLFGTNHKFYGLADLFLNIPVHTGARGIQDLAVKGRQAVGRRGAFAVELHRFTAAQSDGLNSSNFGTELDLTASFRYTDQTTLSAGFSQVFIGDGLEEIGRFSEDVTFGYVMIDVRF